MYRERCLRVKGSSADDHQRFFKGNPCWTSVCACVRVRAPLLPQGELQHLDPPHQVLLQVLLTPPFPLEEGDLRLRVGWKTWVWLTVAWTGSGVPSPQVESSGPPGGLHLSPITILVSKQSEQIQTENFQFASSRVSMTTPHTRTRVFLSGLPDCHHGNSLPSLLPVQVGRRINGLLTGLFMKYSDFFILKRFFNRFFSLCLKYNECKDIRVDDPNPPESLFRCVRARAPSSSSSLRDSTGSRAGEKHQLCALFRTARPPTAAPGAGARSSAANIRLRRLRRRPKGRGRQPSGEPRRCANDARPRPRPIMGLEEAAQVSLEPDGILVHPDRLCQLIHASAPRQSQKSALWPSA